MELNGATLQADDVELYEQYLSLAAGKLMERDFAAWLRERMRMTPPGEAHEPRKPYRVKGRASVR